MNIHSGVLLNIISFGLGKDINRKLQFCHRNEGRNYFEALLSSEANPIWEPGGSQDFAQRFEDTEYAHMTGGYGETSVRETPINQHGVTGKVEPAEPQPRLKGWNAKGFGPRPS